MDYSPQGFNALQEEVERQGGALLPDPCISKDIRFESPPYSKPSTQKKATCGCRNESRMVSVYDPEMEKPQSGSGFITACAVCDSIGAWPRYCETVYAADPDMNIMNREPDEDDE